MQEKKTLGIISSNDPEFKYGSIRLTPGDNPLLEYKYEGGIRTVNSFGSLEKRISVFSDLEYFLRKLNYFTECIPNVEKGNLQILKDLQKLGTVNPIEGFDLKLKEDDNIVRVASDNWKITTSTNSNLKEISVEELDKLLLKNEKANGKTEESLLQCLYRALQVDRNIENAVDHLILDKDITLIQKDSFSVFERDDLDKDYIADYTNILNLTRAFNRVPEDAASVKLVLGIQYHNLKNSDISKEEFVYETLDKNSTKLNIRHTKDSDVLVEYSGENKCFRLFPMNKNVNEAVIDYCYIEKINYNE